MNGIFDRTELLLGSDAMLRLQEARVILFGVGGVGSWCAEGLVRSGVQHLTVVDMDCVDVTNINRQLMATTATVGQVKVEALRDHLLQVNPSADIVAIQEVYNSETAPHFCFEDYDYVVDAIDSLSNKMELILNATMDKTATYRFFSSMGAALKMDPTQMRVSEFWEVDGCPLAAALRRRMRRQKRFPARKFRCVWSPEVLANKGGANQTNVVCPTNEPSSIHRKSVNGSLAHITGMMGLVLSGLVIDDIANRSVPDAPGRRR